MLACSRVVHESDDDRELIDAARAGDRVAIAAYLGRSDQFDRAIAEFAEDYADQNERDYAAFADAVASGRLEAASTV